MKYWFFAALLANVIFLLWEFHYGAFDHAESPEAAPESEEKQILTVSEAAGGLTLPAVSAENLIGLQEAHQALPENPLNSPGAADMPVQAQAAPVEQTTHVLAEPEEKEQTAVSTTPQAADAPAQAPPPKAENQAPTAASVNSEQAQVAAQPQISPAATAANHPDTATQQQPALAEPPQPEILQTACYTAAPVENAAALETLLNRYRPQLSALEFAATEKRKNNSYLVYYPAAATLEQSIAVAETLRSHYGISDLLVFRDGELKGMISLGVFSNEQRAKTAQSQFEAKGVHAEIRPRYPLEVHYTLRMRWNEQQAEAAKQLSNALKKRFSGAEQATRGCK